MTQTPVDPLLTTREAATTLRISRRHLYNLISAGEIATIRIPSRNGNEGEHRIEAAEIERFIKDHREERATA